MRLSWIELTDFRCHASLRVEPDPGVNVFVGDNGSGKTSLLEAIGYLASVASFRRSPDSALVRLGAGGTVVRGEFSSSTGGSLVEVEIPAVGRRRVLLNGKRAAGRAAIAETVAIVAFLPDDLDLVKRGPAYRREYLDDLAVQVWPAAGAEQAEYERAVTQRNALLRRDGRMADATTLDVLDEGVARLGGAVLARRLATAGVVQFGARWTLLAGKSCNRAKGGPSEAERAPPDQQPAGRRCAVLRQVFKQGWTRGPVPETNQPDRICPTCLESSRHRIRSSETNRSSRLARGCPRRPC